MAANDYCTLAEVKAYMPDSAVSATSTYDTLVNALIPRESRSLDKFTNREPGAYYVTADSVRYFDGPGYGLFNSLHGTQSQRLTGGSSRAIALRIGELAAAPTEVAMAQTAVIATAGGSGTYTVVPSTDYYPTPRSAIQFNRPYQALELDIVNGTTAVWLPFKQGIRVTGKFGWSITVPDDIKEAAILMVIRMLRRAQQNYLSVATINDYGQVMQGDRVDDDIVKIIGHYRRMAV